MSNNILTPSRLRIFGITFAATFIVVCLQFITSAIPGIISPIINTQPDVFDNVVPLLREKPRTFSLKKPPTFITSAY